VYQLLITLLVVCVVFCRLLFPLCIVYQLLITLLVFCVVVCRLLFPRCIVYQLLITLLVFCVVFCRWLFPRCIVNQLLVTLLVSSTFSWNILDVQCCTIEIWNSVDYQKNIKQWWSTILPISTTPTITEYKKRRHDIGKPGPGLGQAQQCGRLNQLMGSQTFPSW
jgi:hypothetical protein